MTMPSYCYSNGEETITVQRGMFEEHPRVIVVNGKEYARDLKAEHEGTRSCPGNWPLLSEAAGVHPSQIGEAQEKLAKAGVRAEFTPDGRVKMESPGHRRKVLKAFDLRDRSAWY